MKRSVIVYGPKGCGKSRNAERLMKHFGCSRIVDDWHRGCAAPAPGSLILTCEDMTNIRIRGFVDVVAFDDAIASFGE